MVLQALCTEASLQAMRRHYPQIYDSDEKLLIDPSRVTVSRRDFLSAFSAMTPASHRSATAHARSPPLCLCFPVFGTLSLSVSVSVSHSGLLASVSL